MVVAGGGAIAEYSKVQSLKLLKVVLKNLMEKCFPVSEFFSLNVVGVLGSAESS